MTCPGCGINTEDDMDAVYVTFIPKGQGKLQMDLPMCPSCAVPLRVWLQAGSEQLDDRSLEVRGQETAPNPRPADFWADLWKDRAGASPTA
jgi:hypothetical protein